MRGKRPATDPPGPSGAESPGFEARVEVFERLYVSLMFFSALLQEKKES